jgi:hypothetical protein
MEDGSGVKPMDNDNTPIRSEHSIYESGTYRGKFEAYDKLSYPTLALAILSLLQAIFGSIAYSGLTPFLIWLAAHVWWQRKIYFDLWQK